MSYKPWYYGITFVVIIALIFLLQLKKEPVLPVISKIPEFHLVDQNDDLFTLQNMEGRVWLADFIFTTCSGPCPIMTERMRTVQKDFKDYEDMRFVSFTVNPDYDTPEILSGYAHRNRADTSTWSFVTGNYEEIQNLIGKGFKMGDVDEIVFHSTQLALVDDKGNLRGYYSGTEPSEHKSLKRDIKYLLKQIN
jgi:protein SCO1/2